MPKTAADIFPTHVAEFAIRFPTAVLTGSRAHGQDRMGTDYDFIIPHSLLLANRDLLDTFKTIGTNYADLMSQEGVDRVLENRSYPIIHIIVVEDKCFDAYVKTQAAIETIPAFNTVPKEARKVVFKSILNNFLHPVA